MRPVGLGWHPAISGPADRGSIEPTIGWKDKLVGDDAQFLGQVLQRHRRKTVGRPSGEIALTFFDQGGVPMAREHTRIREELLKHSWISSVRVVSETQPIIENVMWRSALACSVMMRLRGFSTT
jgi:hypothetical protein